MLCLGTQAMRFRSRYGVCAACVMYVVLLRCRASLSHWPVNIDHFVVHGLHVRQGSVYFRRQALGVGVLRAEDDPSVANLAFFVEATKVLSIVGYYNPA